MEYSLGWLRDPAAGDALPGLLTGLVRDIRLILVHPDLGNAAKLAAIGDAVDLLAPPPGPGARAVRDAASVVALLARGTGPATLLLEELAGEEVRIGLAGCLDRPLTARDLPAPPRFEAIAGAALGREESRDAASWRPVLFRWWRGSPQRTPRRA